MKYKLLTFNEDYADEHNIPALAVMTEEEYNIWLESESGSLHSGYNEKIKLYNEQEKDSKKFWNMLKKKGYTINGAGNIGKIPNDDLETKQLEKEYREKHSYINEINKPSKVNSYIYASLGNGGEYFSEQFTDYYLMKEFVADGTINVFDVTKEFVDIFNKARLDDLSLCNIFEIEIDE